MAKKDPEITENEDRSEKPSKAVTPLQEEGTEGKTEVKNAHAAGLGSIGRNDEKLSDEEGGSALSEY
ncbi:MAG TPA: hypothetical protein VHK91_06210 [Flavisolibacter sp.]|jgi:hypothetical protein|nr:hypothetical protein [Flavisolibacter sp.]